MMNRDRVFSGVFCLPFLILHSAFIVKKEFPLDPIQLGFVPAFLILLHHSQSLGDHPQPFFRLAALPIALGQHTQK